MRKLTLSLALILGLSACALTPAQKANLGLGLGACAVRATFAGMLTGAFDLEQASTVATCVHHAFEPLLESGASEETRRVREFDQKYSAFAADPSDETRRELRAAAYACDQLRE